MITTTDLACDILRRTAVLYTRGMDIKEIIVDPYSMSPRIITHIKARLERGTVCCEIAKFYDGEHITAGNVASDKLDRTFFEAAEDLKQFMEE